MSEAHLGNPGAGRPEASNEPSGQLSTVQQHQVILRDLESAPKTTEDLRRVGCFHAPTHIHGFRALGCDIDTEQVTLWDRDGFGHKRVALYTLVAAPSSADQEAPQIASDVIAAQVVPLFPATKPANAGDAEEMRGYGVGDDAIEAMRAARTQAERLRLLHAAVLKATKGPNRRRSTGGLCVALIAYLDHALGL